MANTVIDDHMAQETTEIARGLREQRAKRERRGRLLRYLFLSLFAFVMLYPLLWMVASSLKFDNQIFGQLSIWPDDFVWQN